MEELELIILNQKDEKEINKESAIKRTLPLHAKTSQA